MKTGLIYIIKNKVNNKVYIGQTTTSMKTRFSQHCKKSVLSSRHYKLYNAIKKYGKENFYIELLENNIPLEFLNSKEIEYIEKYNSFYFGYNSTKGGDGRTINKRYDEAKIMELYSNGKTLFEIAKIYDVSNATISRVLNRLGIIARHDGNKYEKFDKIEFKKDWENKNFMINEMAKKYKVDPRTLKRNAVRMNLGRKGVSTIERTLFNYDVIE